MQTNMFITVGTIILLGTFILTSNTIISTTRQSSMNTEFYLTAIALGQSVIEEAKTKLFDQAATVGTVTNVSDLTAPSLLGRDGGGESVGNPDTLSGNIFRSAILFNDVDDYHNYNRRVNTTRATDYNLRTTVTYTSPTFPDSVRNVRTWCKLMTVFVTSPFILNPDNQQDTIRLTYTFCY